MASINTAQLLILGSTNVVRLRRLRDEVTKQYLDDAAATMDLLDAANVPVAGATGLALELVLDSSPPEYRATISHTVALVRNALYTARVIAISADGSRRIFNVACKAVDG